MVPAVLQFLYYFYFNYDKESQTGIVTGNVHAWYIRNCYSGTWKIKAITVHIYLLINLIIFNICILS